MFARNKRSCDSWDSVSPCAVFPFISSFLSCFLFGVLWVLYWSLSRSWGGGVLRSSSYSGSGTSFTLVCGLLWSLGGRRRLLLLPAVAFFLSARLCCVKRVLSANVIVSPGGLINVYQTKMRMFFSCLGLLYIILYTKARNMFRKLGRVLLYRVLALAFLGRCS